MKKCILFSLVIFAFFIGGYVLFTVDELMKLSSMADISVDKDSISENEPLHSTKHIDAHPSPLFRNAADDLRHRYNRNYQICKAVRDRMDDFSHKGVLEKETVNIVEKNLKVLEKRNELIKRRFDEVVAYAEKSYAENLVRTSGPAEEEKARLFAKENDRLLQAVDLPMGNFRKR